MGGEMGVTDISHENEPSSASTVTHNSLEWPVTLSSEDCQFSGGRQGADFFWEGRVSSEPARLRGHGSLARQEGKLNGIVSQVPGLPVAYPLVMSGLSSHQNFWGTTAASHEAKSG